MTHDDKPRIQGEGDYEAAKRYDAAAHRFVESGKVPQAAAAAAPNGLRDAQEMVAAEREGRARSKGEAAGDMVVSERHDDHVSGSADIGHTHAKLWDLIKDIRFSMFTTRDPAGELHARPMTTQNSNLDEDQSLWFFMSRAGDPVAELVADSRVNISYADPGADSYVSVSGTASVTEDMAKKNALWSKMTEAWFPGGVADPDLVLVRVKIIHAAYWNVEASKVMQLFHMAKAVVTGQPPRDLGEHAEVRMG